MPKVEALCISKVRGERKEPLSSAVFVAASGIEGDAHAGEWHRQVSLLSQADVETARTATPIEITPGAFAENVILSGIDFLQLGLGSRIRLGTDVVLSVTQIGKVCHDPCVIARLSGDCIMPRMGLFARVETGGTVTVGDEAEVVSVVPRERFQAVVLTISDRCAAGETEDTAGPAAARLLEDRLDAHVYRIDVLPDSRETLVARLRHYTDGHSIDLVVTVGGTGFSPRDVTPEATRDVVERATPGLDEAMRAASLTVTPHAALSRGASGIRKSTLIVNVPGSRRAAVENLDAIAGALAHGLRKLRGDPGDCGRPPAESPDAS
ncbi:MAG TPA: molybdenum cofactor synthesis domain-containing protein [Planctomycetota bacterium]|nr:molybdenum cofactor synthesis domain-containing protein [Planctomycetota bacterium]